MKSGLLSGPIFLLPTEGLTVRDVVEASGFDHLILLVVDKIANSCI
jgi:hypothetical protein